MHRARHVSWVAIPEGGQMKKIGDVMTGHVCVASPNDSIRKAAELMAQSDIGSLPVGENDRLIGMITDRDIVVRAVARGRGDATLVREVMTEQIRYCFEDEDVLDVAKNMSDLGVRRLPVLDRQKRLVGIVALSNIASGGTDQARDALLEGVATPH
jgi:CBS domain-containing protein